jgi:hypothetical protein
MRTKSLAIILVLTMLILVATWAYSDGWSVPIGSGSGHPWEGYTDGPGGHPSPVSIGHQVIMSPIFSDFFIGIYPKDVNKEGERVKRPDKIGDKSYQVFFIW